MSDYHILQINETHRGIMETVTVVFHIPIPDQNNDAGVPYRTAVASLVNAESISAVPWLQTDFSDEHTAIQAGAVYEASRSVRLPAGLTPVQKRDRLDAYYNHIKSEILSEIQDRMAFWGFNRDVV